MSTSTNVAVIVGSLRAGSHSRKVAKSLIKRAPASLNCRLVEIGDLPLYNEDLDGTPPASWERFRNEVRECQGVLFVTPEYNRSIPGCLKNALDVGSRPQGKSVWNGLPVGVVSVTPYKLGAFGANHALRQTFVFLNLQVMQQPEAYIGGAAELFKDDGSVGNSETDHFLTQFMSQLSQWFTTIRSGDQSRDFADFMQTRKQAGEAYINGNPAPLDALLTHQDPATFFHPGGDAVRGASAVQKRYDADARSFGKGASGELEILHTAASGTLAFWSGLQHAKVRMQGKETSMTVRVTEVFRREEDGWKLVHRHADSQPH